MIEQQDAIEKIRQIKEKLGAEKAFLFGSVARNDHMDTSDVDAIFVLKTDKRFHHRVEDVIDLTPINFPLEPLIYTPEEFEKIKNSPSLTLMLKGAITI